jgi:hypothetical protein
MSRVLGALDCCCEHVGLSPVRGPSGRCWRAAVLAAPGDLAELRRWRTIGVSAARCSMCFAAATNRSMTTKSRRSSGPTGTTSTRCAGTSPSQGSSSEAAVRRASSPIRCRQPAARQLGVRSPTRCSRTDRVEGAPPQRPTATIKTSWPAFPGPGLYFHERAIERRRTHDSVQGLLRDRCFLEYVYAVLPAWGMHRMGPQAAKVAAFEPIVEALHEHIRELDVFWPLRITSLLNRRLRMSPRRPGRSSAR